MSTRFPRRLVLRGFGGLAVALPLLEFTSSRAYGQAAPPPPRFITFFEHGGTLTNHTHGIWEYGSTAFTDGSSTVQGVDGWRPKSTPGQALVLGDIHKPLADANLTGDVVVVRGVDNNAAIKQGPYGSGHGISNVTMLTCAKWINGGTQEQALVNGPSIDQYIGQKWGAPPGGTAVVNLYIDAHHYGSPYFRGASQRASLDGNPQDAFNRLFANVKFDSSTGPDPATVRAQLIRRSILDGTKKELERYKNKLTSNDKLAVEAHLEHVRSIEKRVAESAQPAPATCSKPVLSAFNSIPTKAPLMVDLGLAALRCGVTRILNIEIGDYHMTWDPTPLPFSVGYDIGHSLDHMGNELGRNGPLGKAHPDWVVPWQQAMLRNRQFRAQLVTRLLKGLKETVEGTTTMLDNSLFLWTSEFSNGGCHLGTDMPILLAGRAGGLQTGRYLNYNTKATSNDFTNQYASVSTNNNLYISLLNKLGIADTGFGDMSFARQPGPLAGL